MIRTSSRAHEVSWLMPLMSLSSSCNSVRVRISLFCLEGKWSGRYWPWFERQIDINFCFNGYLTNDRATQWRFRQRQFHFFVDNTFRIKSHHAHAFRVFL